MALLTTLFLLPKKQAYELLEMKVGALPAEGVGAESAAEVPGMLGGSHGLFITADQARSRSRILPRVGGLAKVRQTSRRLKGERRFQGRRDTMRAMGQ